MDINARFKRVTDLFEEGTELLLGYDDERQPVIIWVNKLNSFEVEEARRDGIVHRGLKMRDLGKEDNPEREAFYAEVRLLTDEKLREAWVNQRVEEMYLDVVDEVETDPEMREKVEMMRRLPALLNDSEAGEDDERRQQLLDLQVEYMEALRKGQDKRHREGMKEAEGFERNDLEASFFEKWRERQTLDIFMEERRITEIHLSARECYATSKATGWDHGKCDHSTRLLPERSLVKKMPPGVVEQLIDTLDNMTSSQREAGNSDAPASSSESSERSSASEAPSIPSSPEEMLSAAPTS